MIFKVPSNPYHSMILTLVICAFTTVVTRTDSLQKNNKPTKQKTPQNPHKINQNQHQFISPYPPHFRHKKQFFQRLKLQDQVLQLQNQLEVQRQNCLQVRKITLPLKHAPSGPLNYAVIPTELSSFQKQISTDSCN